MKKSATILLTALLLGPVACESRTTDQNTPGGNQGTTPSGERSSPGTPRPGETRPGGTGNQQPGTARPGETRPGGGTGGGAATPGGTTGGGTAAGGAMGAAESEADRTLSAAARRAITEDPNLSTVAQNINVTASNGVVNLRGTVNSQDQKSAVEQKLRSLPGVTRVNNELEVRGG